MDKSAQKIYKTLQTGSGILTEEHMATAQSAFPELETIDRISASDDGICAVGRSKSDNSERVAFWTVDNKRGISPL